MEICLCKHVQAELKAHKLKVQLLEWFKNKVCQTKKKQMKASEINKLIIDNW